MHASIYVTGQSGKSYRVFVRHILRIEKTDADRCTIYMQDGPLFVKGHEAIMQALNEVEEGG
jgi:predicted alpha/beta superfamily hydrolase